MNRVRITDAARIINGYAFKSELFNTQRNGLPIVRIRDVVRGYSDTFYQGEYPQEYVVQNGDLLIGMDGEFNIGVWRGGTALLNQRVCKIVAKEGVSDNSFLKFRLSLVLKEIEASTPFVTVKHLSAEELKQKAIELPPLPEQKRIAAILDQAARLRRTRRYAQQLSDTFLQSVFLEMFGDPVANPHKFETQKAGNLFEIQLGKMLDAKRFKGTHLRPYLRNANTKWGSFDLSDVKYMDFDEIEFQKYALRRGDILVCEGGEVGRTAIWNGEIPNCCYQNALHRLRPKTEQISAKYFLYFMRVATNFGLIQRETSTVTIAHFTAEKFKEFDVIVPPLPLQQKFAHIVQQFERLRGQQREAERQAEHLFGTLLQRAFRGELS